MRLSVLACDAAVYFPAVFAWVAASRTALPTATSRAVAKLLLLFCPPLLLIDHGHFQYNCVYLGFFIWTAAYLIQSE